MMQPSSSFEKPSGENAEVGGSIIRVPFPDIVEEKISTSEFLEAAKEIVRIVEKLGKIFAPVRYDMQGNIDKLTARYIMDKERNSTLQDMILTEKATADNNLVATDALIWLTRALHMILLFFEKIIQDHRSSEPTDELVAILRNSYKEALEPYHGWIAQQLFGLLSRAVPTKSNLLRSLTDDQDLKTEEILGDIEVSLVNLRRNVLSIQAFYKDNELGDYTAA